MLRRRVDERGLLRIEVDRAVGATLLELVDLVNTDDRVRSVCLVAGSDIGRHRAARPKLKPTSTTDRRSRELHELNALEEAAEGIFCSAGTNTRLEQLTLDKIPLALPFWRSLGAHAGSGRSALQELRLHDCGALSARSVGAICAGLEALPTLHALAICGCELGPECLEPVVSLIDARGAASSRRHWAQTAREWKAGLHPTDDVRLTDVGPAESEARTGRHVALRRLDLSRNRLGETRPDKSAERWLRAFEFSVRHDTWLEVIDLRANGFTRHAAAALAAAAAERPERLDGCPALRLLLGPAPKRAETAPKRTNGAGRARGRAVARRRPTSTPGRGAPAAPRPLRAIDNTVLTALERADASECLSELISAEGGPRVALDVLERRLERSLNALLPSVAAAAARPAGRSGRIDGLGRDVRKIRAAAGGANRAGARVRPAK